MPEAPTAKHALVLPADDDFINTWPALSRDALRDVDTLMATFIEDDPRPAAGVTGRFHRAADGTITFDNGLAWVEIARAAVVELGAVPIGGLIAYAGVVLPGPSYAWADGSLIDRLDGEGAPTEFFNRVGHAYNGGVDPGSNKVRLPDKRGRVSVGADNFGVGAAGRLPNSNRARGLSGGEERHQLTTAELAAHSHGPGAQNAYAMWRAGDAANWPGGTANPFPEFTSTNTGSAGGNGAHNNLQPYEVDNYIVRIA